MVEGPIDHQAISSRQASCDYRKPPPPALEEPEKLEPSCDGSEGDDLLPPITAKQRALVQEFRADIEQALRVRPKRVV